MNSSVLNKKLYNCVRFLRRWKSKNNAHWAVLNKKKFPRDQALTHFDDFYQSVYGDKWKSMRLALLCPNKYCAVVNNYGDTEKTTSDLENSGALNMRTLFNLEKDRISSLNKENHKENRLDKIYKLDEKLERITAKKVQQEVESVYTQNETDVVSLQNSIENTNNPDELPMKQVHSEHQKNIFDMSLQTGLNLAEYDSSRIVDSAIGLTSSNLYEYIPATKLKGMEDWVLESDHYRYYDSKTDFPVRIECETSLDFPEYLNIYTYERGNVTSFKSSRKASTGVLNYYLLDGGSVLPVLALGLKPGDRVLDMCASPGGKSLMALQTLYLEQIVCNDNKESRVRRLRDVLQDYFYNFDNGCRIKVTQSDARNIHDVGVYNKILVDVPCTADRHSVVENDNNIFKPNRLKERLRLPEYQSQILSNALKLVEVGGTVVYSTCTLSPIQNDGVVHMALKHIWQETSIEIVVKDLRQALRSAQCLYRIDHKLGLKYGHLVIPFLPCNYGPMYFCKLVRTK